VTHAYRLFQEIPYGRIVYAVEEAGGGRGGRVPKPLAPSAPPAGRLDYRPRSVVTLTTGEKALAPTALNAWTR
jgi:hypothetical protein